MESARCSTQDLTSAWALSDTEIVHQLRETDQRIQQLQARLLTLIAAADSRGLATTAGAANTAQWVAGLLRIPAGEAGAAVKLSRHVERDLPATAAALERGEISISHARAISKVVRQLPADASTPALREEVDATLVKHARTFDAPTVKRLGERVLETIDPDLADRVLERQLEQEELRAERNRYWRMAYVESTGTWVVDARLPKDVGEQLKVILDPLAKPRTGPAGWDPRIPEQRYADAVGELAHRMLAERRVPSHGGNPTQLVVTVTRSGSGRTLHTGADVSKAVVERLMCEADKALLVRPHDRPGEVSLVTDEQERLFQRKLRRLLEHRDGGCAFPGCDRPPQWCHAHHLVPWSKGGPTTLENGVLLCGFHHRLVHQGHWTVRLARDGLPEFVPPTWIDARGTPIRNHRHSPAA